MLQINCHIFTIPNILLYAHVNSFRLIIPNLLIYQLVIIIEQQYSVPTLSIFTSKNLKIVKLTEQVQMSITYLPTVLWRHYLPNLQTKCHKCVTDIPINCSEEIRPFTHWPTTFSALSGTQEIPFFPAVYKDIDNKWF